MFVIRSVPPPGLRWGPRTGTVPPLSPKEPLARPEYLALLMDQFHVCPVIPGLGFRSSDSNRGFLLNVMYDIELSHFVRFYNSSSMHP